ncbi:MAG: hypothetical protein KY449_06895 [Proteobacteria bacterium]|nr:hypothetical protein [Pseudomonadota bacterium]
MHAALKLGLAAASALLLSACQPELEAPRVRGACYHLVTKEGQEPRFNRLPGNYQSLEYCAAALEVIRRRGGRAEINGAYGGQFLFHNKRGIMVAQRYNGMRYMALVRTGDGRLAMPGAIRQ